MSIYNTLSSRIGEEAGKYANQDVNWVRFVRDHFRNIRNSATLTPIAPEKMAIFRYRPKAYLESLSEDPNMDWIMLLINHMTSKSEFIDVADILIPNATYISELHTSYRTFTSAATSSY